MMLRLDFFDDFVIIVISLGGGLGAGGEVLFGWMGILAAESFW